jgi:hypothetical protein
MKARATTTIETPRLIGGPLRMPRCRVGSPLYDVLRGELMSDLVSGFFLACSAGEWGVRYHANVRKRGRRELRGHADLCDAERRRA